MRDYPELQLLKWRQGAIDSLQKHLEGCYGVFMISSFIPDTKLPLKDWTRAELELGSKCLKAAMVSEFPTSEIIQRT